MTAQHELIPRGGEVLRFSNTRGVRELVEAAMGRVRNGHVDHFDRQRVALLHPGAGPDMQRLYVITDIFIHFKDQPEVSDNSTKHGLYIERYRYTPDQFYDYYLLTNLPRDPEKTDENKASIFYSRLPQEQLTQIIEDITGASQVPFGNYHTLLRTFKPKRPQKFGYPNDRGKGRL